MTPADRAELDAAPPEWRAWWTSSGTLAEHEAGTARWTRHVRPETAPQSTRVMRGPQDYKTLHLGRGTRWIGLKK